MGCSGSKADDLPLVGRYLERRELIRAAADHRFALATAYVSYFKFLKVVGDALKKFVDEELITTSASSSSSLSSPSLVLLPVEKSQKINHESSSHNPGTSGSNGVSVLHAHGDEEDGSHIHMSYSNSVSDEEDDWNYHHHHIHTHRDKDDDDDHHLHHIE